MKYATSCFLAAGLLFSGSALSDTYVQGHYTNNGSYVQPYHRSDSNNTVRDNYSYKGNSNPYTGQSGSNYYRNSPSSSYYGTQPKRQRKSNGW